jgi:hypothetical protein
VKSATHCQLLLPGMMHELAAATSCPPALGSLLRVARREAVSAGSDHAWRCRFFGVARQQDDPVAPFSCLGEGLDPGTDYWLCVNPVTLHLHRDSFVLADGLACGLTMGQARVLTGMLNDHFAAEGMRFFAPHANRWYLRLPRALRLETHPLLEVTGQSVARVLPQGEDARVWDARLNEIQMLLHEHPVNLELEQQGGLPVNSLWAWGGGKLAPAAARPELTVWAQDPFSLGLAQAHGSRTAALPGSAIDWQAGGLAPGEHLVVLDRLGQADLRDDACDWHEALQRMERHWFAPLLAALRDGTITSLALHLGGTRNVSSYTLARPDLHKFWRRTRPLGDYLG